MEPVAYLMPPGCVGEDVVELAFHLSADEMCQLARWHDLPLTKEPLGETFVYHMHELEAVSQACGRTAAEAFAVFRSHGLRELAQVAGELEQPVELVRHWRAAFERMTERDASA
jgi:hypothetical protein